MREHASHAAAERGGLVAGGRLRLSVGVAHGVGYLARQVFKLGLRALQGVEGAHVVAAPAAGILQREVQLVAVAAAHAALQQTAVVQRQRRERPGVVPVGGVLSSPSVEVRIFGIALLQHVDVHERLHGVVLRVVDGLRVRHLGGESLQRLDESEVERQRAVDGHVVGHVLYVVIAVLHGLEVVQAGVAGGDDVLHARVDQRIAVDRAGHEGQVAHQVLVVTVGTAALGYDGVVLLAVVAAHLEGGLHELANVGVHAGTVVPAVVVEFADVTVLVEVADVGKVGGLLRTAAHVDAVAVGEGSAPLVAQQVVVQVLHLLQLVLLEQHAGVVHIVLCGGAGSRYGIPYPPVVVGRQHLRCEGGIRPTQLSVVRYTRSSGLAFLRLHQYHAVGRAGTVDGGCCVLQHGDALHLADVEVVEGLLGRYEVVDDVERRGIRVATVGGTGGVLRVGTGITYL